MKTEDEIRDLFKTLGRTKKVEFISENIQYASESAVAEHVKNYLFDVLEEVEDDEYIATYLRENGYTVEKPQNDKP